MKNAFNTAANPDSVLMQAMKHNDAETVKKLLEIGANVNQHDGGGPAPAADSAPPRPAPETKPAPKQRVKKDNAAPQVAKFRKKP